MKSTASNSPSNASAAARRRFLQGLGTIGAALVAGSAVLPANAQATVKEIKGVTGKHRWGLLIDTTKCATGCDACVRGCNAEHGINSTGNPDTDAQWIRKIELKDNLTGQLSSLPMMCQHCESAPCVDVCPTGASFKRADGVVLVNKHTCIGCRYCMMACPYKARSFIHEPITDQLTRAPRGKGTVESCTLCVHRIDASGSQPAEKSAEKTVQQPACAVSCKEDAHNAITFGDLNDPDSEIVQAIERSQAQQVRADLNLNTGVRYTRL